MRTRFTFTRDLLLFTFLLTFFGTTYAQQRSPDSPNLLNKPKDIAYDTLRKLCYISNNEGNAIVKMDSLRNQEYMLQGINYSNDTS